MRRYFELIDEKSNKFWEMKLNGSELTVWYGKIGIVGREQVKDFDSDEDAKKETLKLINEKLKKGYVEKTPKEAYNFEFDPQGKDGWAFGRPVGISPEQWPRTRSNGTPMAHLFTIRIPEQYRCKGSQYIALSVFCGNDGDGGDADCIDDVKEFLEGSVKFSELEIEDDHKKIWNALREYMKHKHPTETHCYSEVDDSWSMLYLTEKEFSGSECPLPFFDNDFSDYKSQIGMPIFDRDQPRKNLKLNKREGDPNAGYEPEEYPEWLENAEGEVDENISDRGYIPAGSDLGEKLKLNEKYSDKSHFGGTICPVQEIPEELGLFYIEFTEEMGDPNLGGGGVAQINLQTGKVFWAC